MKNEDLIPVDEFCALYEIEFAFIDALAEHGLVEIILVEEARYLYQEHIGRIEKMIRLHHDLDINPEGIDAIFQLLERIDYLQTELNALKNTLSLMKLSKTRIHSILSIN